MRSDFFTVVLHVGMWFTQKSKFYIAPLVSLSRGVLGEALPETSIVVEPNDLLTRGAHTAHQTPRPNPTKSTITIVQATEATSWTAQWPSNTSGDFLTASTLLMPVALAF